MKSKSLMARALYDNVPESHEELAFRKGDILTVLEQNTGGLKGWWLCSLHGRQGIAPGNRLKLLIGPMCEAAHGPAHQAISASGHQSSEQAPEGLYQVPTTRLNICRVAPSSHVPYTGQEVYQVPPNSHLLHSGQDVYQVPPRGHLSYSRQEVYQAPQRLNSKVVNPVCGGHSCAHEHLQQDVYDVPPFRLQGLYPVPPFREASSLQEENYDFPKPTKLRTEGIYNVVPAATLAKPCLHPNYAFLPSSAPTLPSDSDTYDVPPSQHLSSTRGDVYDVPRGTQPSHQRASPYSERNPEKEVYNVPSSDPRPLCDLVDGMNRLSVSSNGSTRSSMSTSSTSTASKDSIAPCSRQAMDLDLAVQRLGYLQQGVEASVSALLALASNPRWRTIESLQRHPHEVRMALERVCQVLTDFVSFSRESVGGAFALSSPSLHGKLHRQLQRLEDSQQILRQVIQALDACGWSVVALAGAAGHRCNDLDRFIMVSRTLPDDVKQLASTIGSNAALLFSSATCNGSFSESSVVVEDGIYSCLPEKDQTKPFPVTCILEEDENSDGSNNGEKCVKSWMEDYDYVHLQGKEEFERQQKELLEKENIIKQNKIQLEREQLIQLKQLEQEVNRPVENDINQWISMKLAAGSSLSSFPVSGGGARRCEWDRQLLCFYSEQCEAHFVTLLNAVDAFFSCVAAGQPPRIFVAHSKLVILSAHKLVFVGDTLSRQAESPEVQGRAVEGSNAMCQLLKGVVGATKTAAQHFPSTAAIQEMVDRVTDLSHRAQQFKAQLQQMAAF